MASKQELQVQEKRALENREEATTPARIFLPTTDICETEDSLTVVMEMPGVNKDNVDIASTTESFSPENGWASPRRYAMRKMIVHGFAAVALGAALAIGLGTHAQAAAPAIYSRACTQVVASESDSVVEKAV